MKIFNFLKWSFLFLKIIKQKLQKKKKKKKKLIFNFLKKKLKLLMVVSYWEEH